MLPTSPPPRMVVGMFSPHLFTHVYDIDVVIAALCSKKNQWLETQTGTLSESEPTNIPTSHRFPIEPLPQNFLTQLPHHPEASVLSEIEKSALHQLSTQSTIFSLPQHFVESRLGGWLRERVKDAALEWLDVNDLIPPSMRHINRARAAKLARSVNILMEDE